MKLYEFSDTSHHKGQLDVSVFISQLGHRMIIPKASDSYHLPDKNNKYDFALDRHTDSRFVDTFVQARRQGMIAHGYHFARFDRPLPIINRDAIVKKNLEYYLKALSELPLQYLQDVIKVGILDMEQSSVQLQAAGLTKQIVSDMAVKMVDLWCKEFENVIFYAGSWWTDMWLTAMATAHIASKTTCWEPEYINGALDPATSNTLAPTKEGYIPSPPLGFKREWVTDITKAKSRIFAWQYSAAGRIPTHASNFDMNVTALEKSLLQEYFGQDIAVDPPASPPPPVPPTPPAPTLPATLDSVQAQLMLMTTEMSNMRKTLKAIQDKLSV